MQRPQALTNLYSYLKDEALDKKKAASSIMPHLQDVNVDTWT